MKAREGVRPDQFNWASPMCRSLKLCPFDTDHSNYVLCYYLAKIGAEYVMRHVIMKLLLN